MTRELYLQYRQLYKERGEIHPEVLKAYYDEHNKNTKFYLTGDEFEYYLAQFIRRVRILALTNPELLGAMETVYERIFRYFDEKYTPQTLEYTKQEKIEQKYILIF